MDFEVEFVGHDTSEMIRSLTKVLFKREFGGDKEVEVTFSKGNPLNVEANVTVPKGTDYERVRSLFKHVSLVKKVNIKER